MYAYLLKAACAASAACPVSLPPSLHPLKETHFEELVHMQQLAVNGPQQYKCKYSVRFFVKSLLGGSSTAARGLARTELRGGEQHGGQRERKRGGEKGVRGKRRENIKGELLCYVFYAQIAAQRAIAK